MNKAIMAILFVFICSGQALATCIGSITSSTPTTDFVDNLDGTVTHSKTGLMWKRCSEGQVWNGTACTGSATTYTWQGALQQAGVVNNGAGYAVYNDWRLPNIKELASIVELQCSSPAINETIFPVTGISTFWSASSSAINAANAWMLYFSFGGDSTNVTSTENVIRLVRDGR